MTNGITPLYMAVQEGQNKTAKLLLDSKAEADKAMINGITPLLIAAAKGQSDIVKLLLDSKAEVDKAETDGWTPLLIAAQKGHTDTAKLLLESKANINKKCLNRSFWKTPLKIAEENERTGVAEAIKQWSQYGRFFQPVGTPILSISSRMEQTVRKTII